MSERVSDDNIWIEEDRNFLGQLREKRQLQTPSYCPGVNLNESYQVTYQQSVLIKPAFNFTCSDGVYSIQSARVLSSTIFTIQTNGSIVLSDWTQLTDNSFQGFTAQYIMQNATGNQVIVADTFQIVVGNVNIQYTSVTQQYYSYDQSFTYDYSTAFDPVYPETGAFTVVWTCPSNFVGCSTLGKTVTFDAVSRISTYKIAFDTIYQFSVKITETKNTSRTVTDNPSFIIISPQSNTAAAACITYSMNITNQASFTMSTLSTTNLQIIVNSLNFLDIKIGNPIISIGSSCYQSSSSKTLAFISQSNTLLFQDIRSYPYNSSLVTITAAQQSGAFSATVKQVQFTSYVYLISTSNNGLLGYNYVTINLLLQDNSLYAVPVQNYIEVASDKILYLDGRSSYDANNTQNSNYTYVWSCLNKTTAVLPKADKIPVYPANRTTWSSNSPGLYYVYSLIIQDATRKSQPGYVTVLIIPIQDTAKCLQLSINQVINGGTFITTTIQDISLTLQIKNGCTSSTVISTQSIVWSSATSPFNQFWTLQSNNQTLYVPKSTVSTMPLDKNFNMTASVRYKIGSSLYQQNFGFYMVIQRQYLYLNVSYAQVVSPRESNIKLDATSSYGTYEYVQGSQGTLQCTWTCAAALQSICNQATYSSSNCIISLSSILLIQSANYPSLLDVAQPFTLTATKGTLKNTTTVYVIISEDKTNVACKISTYNDFSVNQYALFGIVCPTSMVINQYQWSIFSTSGLNITSKMPLGISTSQSYLHIMPYKFLYYKYVNIQCQIQTSTGPQTYIIQKQVNLNDQFSIGPITISANQLSAYVTNLGITPTTLTSYLTNQVLVQLRYKSTSTKYNVFLSKYSSDSNDPMQINMFPLPVENYIYFDTIDQDGNYQSIQQPMVVTFDILINAITINNRMVSIMYGLSMTLNETDYELTVQKIKYLVQAIALGQYNNLGYPASYFQTIINNATIFLYNTIYIDGVLQRIDSNDRIIAIRQSVIDIVYNMCLYNNNMKYKTELLNILTTIVTGQFYFGDMMMDYCLRTYLIFLNLADITYNSLFDSILSTMYQGLDLSIYPGERLTYKLQGYTYVVTQLSQNYNDLPDLSGFGYSKATIQSRGSLNGLFVALMNSTFVTIQLYTPSMTATSIQGLTTSQLVNATFQLTVDQYNSYKSGKFGFSCAIRDTLQAGWVNSTSKIKLLSISSTNGEVICQANQLSLYRLQTWGTYSVTGALWPGQVVTSPTDDGSGGIVDTSGDVNTQQNNTQTQANTSTGTGGGSSTNTSTGGGSTNTSTGGGTTNNTTGGGSTNTSTGGGSTNTSTGGGSSNTSTGGSGTTNTSTGTNTTTNTSTGGGSTNTSTGGGSTNTSTGGGSTNTSTGGGTVKNNTNSSGSTNTSNPNNQTGDQDQDQGGNTGGSWNNSIGNQTNIVTNFSYITYEPLIFEQKTPLMTTLSLLTLVFFILMNIAICIRYKNEHQNYSTNDQIPPKFYYNHQLSLGMNRFYLFKQIFIQFSPYFNLFNVYNQYLARYLRSAITQLYFMAIALIFGVNQALLSYDLSAIGQKNPTQLIAIFFIGVILIVLIRPWSILFFYKLLYEPNGRIQHLKFKEESSKKRKILQDQIMGGEDIDIINPSENAQNNIQDNLIEGIEQKYNQDRLEEQLDSKTGSPVQKQPQELMMLGPTPGEESYENKLEGLVRQKSMSYLKETFINPSPVPSIIENPVLEQVNSEQNRLDSISNAISQPPESMEIKVPKGKAKGKFLSKKNNKQKQPEEQNKHAKSNSLGFTLPTLSKKKPFIVEQEILDSPQNSDSSKSIIHQDNPQAEEVYDKHIESPDFKKAFKKMQKGGQKESSDEVPNYFQKSIEDLKLPKIQAKGGITAHHQMMLKESKDIGDKGINYFQNNDIIQAERYESVQDDELNNNQPHQDINDEEYQAPINYFQEFNMIVDGFGQNTISNNQQSNRKSNHNPDMFFEGGSSDDNDDKDEDRNIQPDQYEEPLQHNYHDEEIKQNNFNRNRNALRQISNNQRSSNFENYTTYANNYKENNQDQQHDQMSMMNRENQDPIDTPSNQPMMQWPIRHHSSSNHVQQHSTDPLVQPLNKQNSITSTIVLDSLNDSQLLVLTDIRNHIGKSYFVNKIIGKWIFLIIWIGLVVANIYCLKHMKEKEFIQWLILSLVTFVILQLVVDPIIYWALACCMLQNAKVNYYIKESISKGCSEWFIIFFIGKAKMRDLARSLNIQNNQQKSLQNNAPRREEKILCRRPRDQQK